jgi:hypothetical protein
MNRRLASALLCAFALAALAGCAGRELQRTDGFARPAASASVRVYVPGNLSVKLVRTSYGSYSRPTIGPADHARAQQQLTEMFGTIEKQLVAGVDERLQQAGLPRGDDVVIALDVQEAFHTDNGPGAIVNVRALFSGAPAGTPVWSFKFQALSSMADDPQKTAAKFTDKVLRELEAAKILAPRKG